MRKEGRGERKRKRREGRRQSGEEEGQIRMARWKERSGNGVLCM